MLRIPRATVFSKLTRAVAGLALILCAGTIGYHLIEPGVDYFRAFYMTAITVSTVGFGEIEGLGPNARPLTILLIFGGMGMLSYVLFAIAQAVVEGQIQQFFGRRKLDKRISRMRGHVILCGFGRVGEIIASQLQEAGIDFVVVEQNEDRVKILEEREYPYLIGDATEDELLTNAGVQRASALFAATHPDAQNIFITLTARELSPDVRIVARAYEDEAEKRLIRAGANQVVYPDRLSGMRMAATLLRPGWLSFIEVLATSYRQGAVEVEELTVGENCAFHGRTLMEAIRREKFNLIILAIRGADGSITFNPHKDTTIASGDTLFAMGTRNNIEGFAREMDAVELQQR